MKKLLKLIGKYKIFLVFSVIFAAISVVLQLYVPVLFGDAIDEVVSAHQVNFDMMWYYLKQILIFIVISAFATWFMNLLNNRMTYRIVQDIRSQAIRHIQVLPLSYLDQHSTGDIVSRVIAKITINFRKSVCHCRYRDLIRWSVVGIYTVIFRNCDDRCDTDFHVL